MKGKALRRALQTTDLVRINGGIPLLTDETESITPTRAYELLETNTKNRPINWARVEAYADIMKRGDWKVHGQGLLLDTQGNILTGQHRLWAVIYADVAVPMRVSKGNSPDVAHVIDRGIPQSARDLASRETGRKHSPVEASLARAALAINGQLRPNTDVIAQTIINQKVVSRAVLLATQGTKKTRSVLMILGAICHWLPDAEQAVPCVTQVDALSAALERRLEPQSAATCWGRGAAFGLAMHQALQCVKESVSEAAP